MLLPRISPTSFLCNQARFIISQESHAGSEFQLRLRNLTSTSSTRSKLSANVVASFLKFALVCYVLTLCEEKKTRTVFLTPTKELPQSLAFQN